MLSTPRQLRVSVNRKVLNPQTPGEPNIFDFEILLAFRLTTQRDFRAKTGHTVLLSGIAIAPADLPGPRSPPSIHGETLTLSVEQCTLGWRSAVFIGNTGHTAE